MFLLAAKGISKMPFLNLTISHAERADEDCRHCITCTAERPIWTQRQTYGFQEGCVLIVWKLYESTRFQKINSLRL